jgi:hypothetical protein
MNSHEKWLRQAAEEIAAEGHAGWGNTCEQAADQIAELQAEVERLNTRELEWKVLLRDLHVEMAARFCCVTYMWRWRRDRRAVSSDDSAHHCRKTEGLW